MLEDLRLLKNINDPDLATIDGYERFGGYRAMTDRVVVAAGCC